MRDRKGGSRASGRAFRDDGGASVARATRPTDLTIRGGARVELQLRTEPESPPGVLLLVEVSIRDATGAHTLRLSLDAEGGQ